MASSSVFGGFYNRKNEGKKGSSALYNFLQVSCIFSIWLVVYLCNFSFDWRVILYSLLFGGFYTICVVGTINALKTGPVSLTSLFMQLSLIVVTLWGFLFWGDKITLFAVIGLILVVISLCLCLYKGKSNDEKKFNGRWLFFAGLMLIGNAGDTIMQRTQQANFNGAHGPLLMVFATGISALVCLTVFLKADKTDCKEMAKTSWYYPVLAGGCNVGLNLFVMLLATSTLSPSVIYPVICVGGLIVSMIFSIVAFKEKLKWQQWIGVVIGAIAVVILSI